MTFIKKLIAFIFMAMMISAGMALIYISLDIFKTDNILNAVNFIRTSANYKYFCLSLSGIFIIIGLVIPYKTISEIDKSRSIRFKTDDGAITVSVAAIEDYLKKITRSIASIKTIKSKVKFTRREIRIVGEITVNAAKNVQELTENIQRTIKYSVQSMLGGQANVTVVLHISKVAGITPVNETPELKDTYAPNKDAHLKNNGQV